MRFGDRTGPLGKGPGIGRRLRARGNRDARDGDGDARVALITMDPSRIGQMSCNPAIGGLAKGQMVREIDALGGMMGLAIDAAGIMFKMLNTSKGAEVRGPRAQADKYAYAAEVQRLLSTRERIDVIAGTVDDRFLRDSHGTVVCVLHAHKLSTHARCGQGVTSLPVGGKYSTSAFHGGVHHGFPRPKSG